MAKPKKKKKKLSTWVFMEGVRELDIFITTMQTAYDTIGYAYDITYYLEGGGIIDIVFDQEEERYAILIPDP